MRSTRHGAGLLAGLVAAGAAAAGLAVSSSGASAAADPTATADVIAGATLDWGLSNEANNAGFAPGTYNLFSAGRIDDPGRGGQQLDADTGRWPGRDDGGWAQRAGNAEIVQATATGTRPATWGSFRTDAAGNPVAPPSSTVFSAHLIRFDEGTGWIDRGSGRAHLRWDADATVLFYSGMTFYYVSDPELDVAADGSGVLSATLGGFGTDMADPTIWEPLEDTRVVLADLPSVDLAATTLAGTPAYAGVRVDVPAGGVAQVTSGEQWGSWPQTFVDFQQQVGQAPYWYSSGGLTDAFKVALPLAGGFTPTGETIEVPDTDPADPELPGAPPTPTPTPTATPTATPTPTPTATPSGTPTPTPSGTPTGPAAIDDAQLRWGLSNEANNAAFAPGTHNFFAAGRIPDPGRGGSQLPARSWRAIAGDVRIEKRAADGSWRTATWSGLGTDADGSPITSPTSGRFSGHQVVLSGGEGTVDVDAGTAEVRWGGDFTVVFYSGMTFFYVSDPALSVRGGRGVLTATLGGFGTSMTDTSQWDPLPERRVTLATLPDVDLAADGFTATPAYRGVRYAAGGDLPAQQTGGPDAGAFPTSFLDYLAGVGSAAYWYSSGGSTDPYKPALPLAVGFDGSARPPDDPGPGEPTSTPGPPAGATPSASLTASSDPGDPGDPGSEGDDSGLGAAPSPTTGASPAAAGIPGRYPTAGTLTGSRPVASASRPAADHRLWWLGGSLLAVALAAGLGTARTLRRNPSDSRPPGR